VVEDMNKVMNSGVSSSASPSKVIGVSVYSDNVQSAEGNTPALEMIMESQDLKVHYGSYLAVRDVNLQVHKNEITALIGPSGCGKSTILRCFNRMNDLIPTAKVSGSVQMQTPERCDVVLEWFFKSRIHFQNQSLTTLLLALG
jgi:ABC-type glutathione transport system ATPase component